MIFIGEPNLYVKISNKTVYRLTGKKGFQFDANGKFETDNEVLIKVLKQHFDTKEGETIKVFKCKKCGLVVDNKGALMAHYRSEHPKEER